MSKCMGCGELGCVCWDTGPSEVWSYSEDRWFLKWRRHPTRIRPWILALGFAAGILFIWWQ